jgi:predicted RNA-binding protein (virulence factor B family)
LGDKSSPEAIRKEFQVSKKVYKQAIGGLYKQGKIKITNQGIELVRH